MKRNVNWLSKRPHFRVLNFQTRKFQTFFFHTHAHTMIAAGACALFLLTTAAQVAFAAVDCNACEYRCGWSDLSCAPKKTACRSAAAGFEKAMTATEAVCANAKGRMDDMDKIDAAKDALIAIGVFNRRDFDGVQVRWCAQLGDFAYGMVPSANKILLHPDAKSDGTKGLAALLAHEMHHIQQYRTWGSGGFRCRYSVQLASGKGFERANAVEAPAYNFEDEVKAKLRRWTPARVVAPSSSISTPQPSPTQTRPAEECGHNCKRCGRPSWPPGAGCRKCCWRP